MDWEKQVKITAIHGGVDWADASAEYVILPDGMDYEVEYVSHRKWYFEEYLPAVRRGEKIKYVTIFEWLIKRGARKPTDEQLNIVYDWS